MKYLAWLVRLPVSWAITLFTWTFGWLFAMPYTMKITTDTVKLYGKQTMTFDREQLIPIFSWFGTDDNSADEWFFGCYWVDTWWAGWLTIKHYNNAYYGWLIRYACRVFWLYRNAAYKLLRTWLGLPKDSPLAWQYKGDSIIKGRTVNIGWKAHDGIHRLLYAGRLL